MPVITAFSEPPDVRGFVHQPRGRPSDGIVLTHGAGSDCKSFLLVGVASGLAELGWTVLRCDLPFRQRRPHGPPVGSWADRDQEGLRHAVASLKNLTSGRIYLGGHSYGGRQASMLAASDPKLVDGLMLLSYPLHPPQRPEQLRTEHLPRLRTRALFVHGSRDSFGTTQEMRAALALVPAETKLVILDKAGHDLGGARAAGEVIAAFRSFFAGAPALAG